MDLDLKVKGVKYVKRKKIKKIEVICGKWFLVVCQLLFSPWLVVLGC